MSETTNPQTEAEARRRYDNLVHDAEHAEGGAQFARGLMNDPETAARCDERARALRTEAQRIADLFSLNVCEHGYLADECTLDSCFDLAEDDY
jgi:hypothetical protein